MRGEPSLVPPHLLQEGHGALDGCGLLETRTVAHDRKPTGNGKYEWNVGVCDALCPRTSGEDARGMLWSSSLGRHGCRRSEGTSELLSPPKCALSTELLTVSFLARVLRSRLPHEGSAEGFRSNLRSAPRTRSIQVRGDEGLKEGSISRRELPGDLRDQRPHARLLFVRRARHRYGEGEIDPPLRIRE